MSKRATEMEDITISLVGVNKLKKGLDAGTEVEKMELDNKYAKEGL